MKNTRIFENKDGSTWQQTWGYCRESNARLIGWAITLLAAVLGLVLLCLGRHAGLHVVVAAAASFGFAWVAEAFPASAVRPVAYWASVGCELAAYIIALGA